MLVLVVRAQGIIVAVIEMSWSLYIRLIFFLLGYDDCLLSKKWRERERGREQKIVTNKLINTKVENRYCLTIY